MGNIPERKKGEGEAWAFSRKETLVLILNFIDNGKTENQ